MKQLGVKFGDTQDLSIEDLANAIDGVNKSSVARAAMQLGIEHIKKFSARSADEAKMIVVLNDAKGRQ